MIKQIDKYLQKLFPISRSITGNGNRETLQAIQKLIPLNILEYQSGQDVYDWTIPKEWNIIDGWIKDSNGDKIVDFKKNNLHVVGYSESIHQKMNFDELKKNLYYLKNLPNAIPYRTSYYNENWGFCLSYEEYEKLDKLEQYEIFIDSELKEGSLSIGEILIEGKSKKEILLSCYICHPSMANDSLSGILTTAFITEKLLKIQAILEHSYRIIFVPETIGAIAYSAKNEDAMKNIDLGFVLTTCGGPGKFGYKQSFNDDCLLNALTEETFNGNNVDFIKYPFDINGSDERQYSSQGLRINTVTITKDKYYEYDYYHTSLDDLDFVKAEYIQETINIYMQLIEKVDKNIVYKNLYPNCEIKLGKHNIYSSIGGSFLPNDKITKKEIVLWLLFYCDGTKSLYEISKILKIEMKYIYEIAKILNKNNILGYFNE